jgi:hypothetical protein
MLPKYNRLDSNLHRAGLSEYVCYDGTWCDGNDHQTKQLCHKLEELRLKITDQTSYWDFINMIRHFFSINCHTPSSIKKVCPFSRR